MSSTKTTPTNGAAKQTPKVETTVSATNGTKANNETKPDVKIPAAVIPISKTADELPPLEDRFYRLDVLLSLREKHEALKESLDKINKFKFSADGRNDSITFKDSFGNTFGTHNPDVLSKTVEWLREDLTKKIKETEAQIML